MEERRFYTKLSTAVISMFVSPMAMHMIELHFGLTTSVIPFLSLGLVLFFMGTICKLVLNREGDKAKRKEKKIKNK